jgi:probable addiction module antidote protein
MTDVREFDAAYHLDNPKVIAAYLEEAFGTGDKAFIARAFKTVARARGMEDLAKNLGMSRSGLYKALGPEGNPSFSTMLQLLSSLGMSVNVRPLSDRAGGVSVGRRRTGVLSRARAAKAKHKRRR